MVKNIIWGTIALYLQLILSLSADAAEKCIYRRYIFDIGSSTTKSAAYTVDGCKKVIISKNTKHLHQNYRYCLVNDGSGYVLPEECMDRGIAVLHELEQHYGIDCRKNHCIGFATAWARDAMNTDEWLQKVGNTGIKMHLLSQEKEGILSFKALENKVSQYGVNRHEMIVLDIGGGSTQISGLIGDSYFSYKGAYGTDTFISHLLSKFRPEENNISMTEHIKNPVMFRSSEIEEIIKYSSDYWYTSITRDEDIVQKIKDGRIYLVGIGVLMRVGIRKQMGLDKEVVTKDEIRGLIQSMCDLDKDQLNAKYPQLKGVAFSSQSAMLILYSIMNALEVESIRISEDDVMSYVALHPRALD